MGFLTDLQLRAWVKVGAPIAGKSDGEGLTFTYSRSGVASWVFRYRIAGRQRELTLGRYPDISLAKARALAAENRVAVQQVIDVATVKQQKKVEVRSAGTVAELAELWLDHAIRKKHKHPKVTERIVQKDILPHLGKRAPKDVKGAEITRLLAAITASGRPTIANDALRYLKAMFDYGCALGLVDNNPAERIKTSHAGGKEEARTRYLSQAEISRLLEVIQQAGPRFGRDNELAVKLLLVTGCRKMELLGAQWAEFDLGSGAWRIPAARTKTGVPRELPLPSSAVAWLVELRVRACGSRCIFPARRMSKVGRFLHVSPDTLNAAIKGLDHGLESFTVHDLRRTARSLMSDLGIPFDVAEKALGHRLPGTAAIYDQGRARSQIKIALEKLARKITSLEPATPITTVPKAPIESPA